MLCIHPCLRQVYRSIHMLCIHILCSSNPHSFSPPHPCPQHPATFHFAASCADSGVNGMHSSQQNVVRNDTHVVEAWPASLVHNPPFFSPRLRVTYRRSHGRLQDPKGWPVPYPEKGLDPWRTIWSRALPPHSLPLWCLATEMLGFESS